MSDWSTATIFPALKFPVCQFEPSAKASATSISPKPGRISVVGSSTLVGTVVGVLVGGNQTMVADGLGVTVAVDVNTTGVASGTIAVQAVMKTTAARNNKSCREQFTPVLLQFGYVPGLRIP